MYHNETSDHLDVNKSERLLAEHRRRDVNAETARPWLDPSMAPVAAVYRPRPEPRVIDANDPNSVLADAKREMVVVSNDGTRVGAIDEICLDDAGKRTSVVVRYGRLTRRWKLVDGTLIDLIDDDLVMLSIDRNTFRLLPDAQICDRPQGRQAM